MNTAVKIGLIAGVAGVAYWAYTKAQQAIANFTYEVVGYGAPSVSNYILRVPVKVKFNNPTGLSINIDHLIADVYVLKGSSFVKSGQVSQPVSLPPGESIQTIYATADLKAIFGGNIIDTANSILALINSRKITVKTEITVLYKGVSLPTQTISAQEISFA